MHNKRLFAVALIALQLTIPAFMLRQHLNVLRNGAVYRFKAVPVDPYDALRGRYIDLSVENKVQAYTETEPITRGQVVYAILGKDNEGFAVIEDVSVSRPAGGDYIRTAALYDFQPADTNRVYLPFKRFYMNEYKAKQAEKLYSEHAQSEKSKTYITVRVFRGQTAIEDLYLADKPIERYFD